MDMIRKLAVTIFALSFTALGCGSDNGTTTTDAYVPASEAGTKPDLSTGTDTLQVGTEAGQPSVDVGTSPVDMAVVPMDVAQTSDVTIVPVDAGTGMDAQKPVDSSAGVDSGTAVDAQVTEAAAVVDGGANG
jgi:hypothetical protein